MEKLTTEKLAILNKIILYSIMDENNTSIITKFAEKSIEVLDADFCFAWGRFDGSEEYQLVYKSKDTPYNPTIQEKRKGTHLIPIRYGDHVYGSIIVGYKKPRDLTEEELVLAETIGNMVSRAVTINWLVEKEQKALALVEKQKETEVLLEQEKLRTEFIGNATHELRTPLAIMKGNIDLALMYKEDSNFIKKALKAVNVEIHILSEILKDMALMTSENKNIEWVGSKVDIHIMDLLNQIVKRLKVVAHKKNITIQINAEENRDIVVWGDEKYLEKLFLNIIKNAITYSNNDKQIVIDTLLHKNTVEINISDNGIGISKEDLPKIFERFYRVDHSHTTNTSYGSHSGLGLAIAKWAAEIHGGEISVKSIQGKGTIFTVTLPLSKEKKLVNA